MRSITKKQVLNGTLVRPLLTAMVMTGWMVFTGCSYLQHPNPPTKQVSACIDKGRSGYWCPDSSSTIAANLSEERATAKNDLLRLQGEKERVEAEIAELSKDRDRLSKELSTVKQQIMGLEVQLEQMGQSKHN
ncbi:MAG: hypothetical protein QM706_13995 [Nitrospira sp.]